MRRSPKRSFKGSWGRKGSPQQHHLVLSILHHSDQWLWRNCGDTSDLGSQTRVVPMYSGQNRAVSTIFSHDQRDDFSTINTERMPTCFHALPRSLRESQVVEGWCLEVFFVLKYDKVQADMAWDRLSPPKSRFKRIFF